MKKCWSGILCLLLVAVLFAGCTDTDGAPSGQAPGISGDILPSSASAVESGPVEATVPPVPGDTWQEAYCEVATSYLGEKGTHSGTSIELLYPHAGPPHMALKGERFGVAQGVWKMVDGAAHMIYSGLSDFCINTETGNLVVVIHSDESVIASEVVDGKLIPVYRQQDDYEAFLYVYAEDKTYTQNETTVRRPIEKLPIQEPTDRLIIDEGNDWITSRGLRVPAGRQKIQDFFGFGYTAQVSAQAPHWVKEYIEYMHSHWIDAYEKPPLDWYDLERQPSVTFYEQKDGNMPPLVRLYAFNCGDVFAYSLFLIPKTKGLCGLRTEYILDLPLQGYDPWQDEHGNLFHSKYEKWNYWDWYVLGGERGMEFLFAEGILDDGRPIGYGGEESKDFGPSGLYRDEMEEWWEEQRIAMLQELGYGGQLTPAQGKSYNVERSETWEELEQQLMEIFCQYARDTGQWGV